ncbi:MAG TPA: hypothetical protein QGG59_09565 [Planctomycetota bacterium]|nr:hypothetical protein [Planctomycetota bacterium]|tara:strand:+ start:5672 stop:7375 length:1704 start_codon:yes stop_codon:yes gene_type:complete
MRHFFALLAILVASPLSAQSQAEYFMYGGTPSTTDWEIRRTMDLDGDGVFLSAGEAVQFAFDSATLVTYVENVCYEAMGGTPAVFGGGGNDVILKMVDLDGDGVAMSPGEVITFADTRASHGVTNTSPDGVDFDPNTGVMYVTDDLWSGAAAAGSGISSYVDLDNDGLALSAGEMTLFVDGTSSLTVPGTGGTPVTIGLTDFEAVMVDSAGVVIGFEQQDRNLYAFQDLNGDGDAMDAGEAWNFCNLIDDVPGLDVNVDIASGVMVPPRCASTSGTGWYGSLESLSVEHGAGASGADVYWIASTASNSSCAAGAGLVYRGEDLNGDYDLNDSGEIVMWLDGANNNFMLYPVSTIYGGGSHDGGFSFFQGNGPFGTNWNQNTCYFTQDLNADGDAMDAGETEMMYAWAPDGCYAVSMGIVPKGAFATGPAQPFFEILGTPGSHSIGTDPSIGFIGVPGLGQTFDITLTDSIPLASNFLAIGWSNTSWNGKSLPFDLTGIGAPGNNLYVSLDFLIPGQNTSTGEASKTLSVPNNPAWAGRDVYFQWRIFDSVANAFGSVTSDYVHGFIN